MIAGGSAHSDRGGVAADPGRSSLRGERTQDQRTGLSSRGTAAPYALPVATSSRADHLDLERVGDRADPGRLLPRERGSTSATTIAYWARMPSMQLH
jgi:hypothetical protein